jgi:hypothetical protein
MKRFVMATVVTVGLAIPALAKDNNQHTSTNLYKNTTIINQKGLVNVGSVSQTTVSGNGNAVVTPIINAYQSHVAPFGVVPVSLSGF